MGGDDRNILHSNPSMVTPPCEPHASERVKKFDFGLLVTS
jgi:hypothetical protein